VLYFGYIRSLNFYDQEIVNSGNKLKHNGQMLNFKIMQTLIYIPCGTAPCADLSNYVRIKKLNGSLILQQDPYLEALTE
jgi:hypothetical protein